MSDDIDIDESRWGELLALDDGLKMLLALRHAEAIMSGHRGGYLHALRALERLTSEFELSGAEAAAAMRAAFERSEATQTAGDLT
jgi:hypothetical protein